MKLSAPVGLYFLGLINGVAWTRYVLSSTWCMRGPSSMGALFVDVGWKKAYSHIDAVTVLDCEGKMANPNALRVKRPLLSFESCSTICAINDKKQVSVCGAGG